MLRSGAEAGVAWVEIPGTRRALRESRGPSQRKEAVGGTYCLEDPEDTPSLCPAPSSSQNPLMLSGSFAAMGFGSHTCEVCVFPTSSSSKLLVGLIAVMLAVCGAFIVATIC